MWLMSRNLISETVAFKEEQRRREERHKGDLQQARKRLPNPNGWKPEMRRSASLTECIATVLIIQSMGFCYGHYKLSNTQDSFNYW